MRFLIPTCLKLDDAQIKAVQEWAAQFPYPEYEEDCCGTGHTFKVTGSGIGDSISVEHRDRGKIRKFQLGYDDDGVIMGEIT